MPAQLLALDTGPSILLDKPILLLGRHPECDIQIDSRKISRRHCCIAQVSDYLVVRDLGSTNGIRINGIRVVEGRLSTGDELTIGNARYKLTWDAQPILASPPSAGAGVPPVALASARRPTIRESLPPAGVEDELLESCDEPVPLAEPGPDGPPGAVPISPPPPPSPAAEESFLLPDELELMPNSDVISKDTPKASGSGIHPPA
ncbi:MAG TPA: FHA domain-containing protein [Gemmataceae bacterium]|nr:FHA domain-containing protein [Gemmataceae bacterium]